MIRKLKAGGYLFSAAALFSASLFFAYAGYSETRVGLHAGNWVAASTTITYSYTVRTVEHGRTGTTDPTGIEYALSPAYSFTASDGKTYSGNTYSTFGDKIDRSYNQDVLKSHLVESRDIYYNPENPRQSAVIKPGFNLVVPYVFAFSAALCIIIAYWFAKSGTALLSPHKRR